MFTEAGWRACITLLVCAVSHACAFVLSDIARYCIRLDKRDSGKTIKGRVIVRLIHKIVFVLFSLTFSCSVSADPFRIQDVKAEMEAFGAENIEQVILNGQPTIKAEINRFGVHVGLRDCSRLNNDEDLYCYEAAFKSCVQLLPIYERPNLLELANSYNMSRRLGQMYIETAPYLGNLMCIKHRSDFEIESIKFKVDYVYTWRQTLDDFRGFLIEEDMGLVDGSVL